jgi:hypothetical protein
MLCFGWKVNNNDYYSNISALSIQKGQKSMMRLQPTVVEAA